MKIECYFCYPLANGEKKRAVYLQWPYEFAGLMFCGDGLSPEEHSESWGSSWLGGRELWDLIFFPSWLLTLILFVFKFTAFCFLVCFLLEAFVCCYCPDRGEALSIVVSKPCCGVLGKKPCPYRYPVLSSPRHSYSSFHDSNWKSIFKYPWFLPIATALIMLVSACHQILPVYSSSSVLRRLNKP